MIQLPVTRSGDSDYDLTLDGVTYTFQYRYNTRNKRIYLNILREDVEIIMGVRLIENISPNQMYSNPDAPKGLLLVMQMTDEDKFATLGNFGIGENFNLVYASEQEVIDFGFFT